MTDKAAGALPIKSRSSSSTIGVEGGFSLIELMIVVVMITILVAVSGPSFVESLARNKRQSALSDTLSMLTLARSEAAIRATRIVACASEDQSSCTDTGEWENGYLLFVDNGEGGGTASNFERDGTEEIVFIGEPMPLGITLRSASFADASVIAFSPQGTALERGTFQICDKYGVSEANAIILNRSGQPRLAIDENNDGVVNSDAGAATNVGCPA